MGVLIPEMVIQKLENKTVWKQFFEALKGCDEDGVRFNFTRLNEHLKKNGLLQ